MESRDNSVSPDRESDVQKHLVDSAHGPAAMLDHADCYASRGEWYRRLVTLESHMRDEEIRAALGRHWAASDANDFETEHDIYLEDAVLDYPQSGERIRSRRYIQLTRAKQPSKKRFAVQRIIGSGDLWITEYILTYDGKPSYTVSIMEFSGDKVARETQYFAGPFEASTWRAQWVERMGT
jgi:hypothetical protein